MARVIDRVDADTLDAFVGVAIGDKVSLIATDEGGQYHRFSKSFPHDFITHGRGEYVRGNVHTQTIDGFWSLLERGIMGTFHNVSRKYLPLYVAEFEWRHNNRKNSDIFGHAIAAC